MWKTKAKVTKIKHPFLAEPANMLTEYIVNLSSLKWMAHCLWLLCAVYISIKLLAFYVCDFNVRRCHVRWNSYMVAVSVIYNLLWGQHQTLRQLGIEETFYFACLFRIMERDFSNFLVVLIWTLSLLYLDPRFMHSSITAASSQSAILDIQQTSAGTGTDLAFCEMTPWLCNGTRMSS